MIKFEQNLKYSISLLLSTTARKTCESLGKAVQVSGDSMLRILHDKILNVNDLAGIAKKFFRNNIIYLIIDDSLIDKLYSTCIEGTSDNFSSADNRTYRSLCTVVAGLTDGKTFIPINQQIWTAKEFNEQHYKKKWEIAHELIAEIQQFIPIKFVIADGLYATENMMRKCQELGIFFEMRMHSNRVIEINGTSKQIKHIDTLKLNGRRFQRTKKGIWNDLNLYFTAVNRINKNGIHSIVYQVSNFKAIAKKHVQFYSYRWSIEMFFRTAKQHLGLNDCQTRTKKSQENHIKHVFLAYILLQIERLTKCLKNAEEALRRFKLKNYKKLKHRFMRSDQIFECFYA